jgi:mono/diheme cytochrome c family protein
MRERLARALAILLTATVVALAAFFADRHNPALTAAEDPAATAEAAPAVPPPDPASVQRGRAVYEREGCARCHEVAGSGNPRSPLDGVGARRAPEELRAWVTASAIARAALSRSAIRVKEGFGSMPEGDLEVLVAFVSSLR